MNTVYALTTFLVGASIGSFINVIVYRFQNPHKHFWTGHSHCFSCQKNIATYDLIPILSWFILRGRCRNCHSPFSWRYPAVEFFLATISLCLWFKHGISITLVEQFIFCTVLTIIALIDLDTWIIPSSLTNFLIVSGLGFAYDKYHYFWNTRTFGLMMGFSMLALVLVVGTWIFRRNGRLKANETAMGWGDPVLFGAIGSYLGIQSLSTTLLIASLIGIVSYRFLQRQPQDDTWTPPTRAIPFGPFLALAAMVELFL